MKKKDKFKLAAYGSITSALLVIPIFVISFLEYLYKDNIFLKYLFIVLGVILFIAGIITLCGYLQIAKDHKLKNLRKFALIYLVLTVLAIIIIFIQSFMTIPNIFSIIWLIIVGIVYICFGVVLKKIKTSIIQFSDNIGLLYLILGIASCTIIGFIIMPFLEVALSILEAKMFFNKARNTK